MKNKSYKVIDEDGLQWSYTILDGKIEVKSNNETLGTFMLIVDNEINAATSALRYILANSSTREIVQILRKCS